MGTEEEALDHLFEYVDVVDLVALAASKAKSVVEEQVKGLILVLQNFNRMHMLLSHISLRNVCCLVVRHQIQVE